MIDFGTTDLLLSVSALIGTVDREAAATAARIRDLRKKKKKIRKRNDDSDDVARKREKYSKYLNKKEKKCIERKKN